MRLLSDSLKNTFPVVLSDGYIGVGINSGPKSDAPFFFLKGFNEEDATIKFQPQHYYKYNANEHPRENPNQIVSEDIFPSDGELQDVMNTFIGGGGPLQKVVLAQTKTYTFENDLDPYYILTTLITHFPKENIFAYIPDGRTVFFGSSPECLYTREDNKITIDCIAGTALAGEEALLFSEKNQNEHRFVTDFVVESLEGIASNIITSDVGIKKARHLIHLYQTVSSTLHPDTSDKEIITRLHPTPAVLGYPKMDALAFLKAEEKFNRGPYAGCLGWMSKKTTKLRVGIRSGLIQGNTLTLFAGAGITKESNPEKEIVEIKNKFKTLEGGFP